MFSARPTSQALAERTCWGRSHGVGSSKGVTPKGFMHHQVVPEEAASEEVVPEAVAPEEGFDDLKGQGTLL